EAGPSTPSKIVHARNIEQLTGGAIGLAGIKDDAASKSNDFSDRGSQLLDRQVAAGTDVEGGKAVLGEERVEARVRQTDQEQAGVGEVFAEQELAPRRPRTPDRDGPCPRLLSAMKAEDERGNNVRALFVITVARTIKIRGHGGQESRTELLIVGPTHLDT